jgi:hypothetical protein
VNGRAKFTGEHRIERRLTGDTIPADAVYMTTLSDPHPAGDEVEGLERRWHYFRVPIFDEPDA